MMDQHIGHIHTGSNWGGGENQVLNLLHGLTRKGIKTTLYANPKGELLHRALKNNLPAVPLPINSYGNLFAGFSRRIRNQFQKNKIDLLHVHDSLATTIGSSVARHLQIPVVLSRRIASPLRRNILSRNKYSEKKLDAVIAISHTVKDVFCQNGYPQENVYVVASGVDIDALDKIEKNESFTQQFGGNYLVGGIGKLSVKKNWQFMIRVAAHLKECGQDIQWVVIGDGPEKNRLKRLAKSSGVNDRIHFLGFQPDAVKLLKNFDVLFFPSLMEGASVTVRDAMVMAVPVVAVDAPGTMESLDGHGWRIQTDDVPNAANSVLEALLDPILRDKRCIGARASAIQRFSINRTVEDTISVYRAVLTK